MNLPTGAAASVAAMNDTRVVMVQRVRTADEVSERVSGRHFLYAGPPIELADVTGPMRGAYRRVAVQERSSQRCR